MFDITSFADFYKNKTVLITGHTGFKGSILSVWLTSLGARVVGLSDKYPIDADGLNWLSNCIPSKHRVAQQIMVDIRNAEDVERAIRGIQPDIIFHLAAQALVKTAYAEPHRTFTTNVVGTLNVLNAYYKIFKDSVEPRALVCITSDKCYQNVEQIWGYRESDRIGGDDPYSASKGCAELIINSYMQSFLQTMPNCGIASVRAGNVIGGGDCSDNRLIPDCVRAIYNDTPITMRNPNATRPWLHVFEPLSGYMLVGKELYNNPTKFSTNFNFGPKIENNKSVGEVVKLFASNFNRPTQIICHEPDPDQHECGLLNLDVTKSYRMLDWSSRWNIEDALTATAEWYQNVHANKDNALSITLLQISDYCNDRSYNKK